MTQMHRNILSYGRLKPRYLGRHWKMWLATFTLVHLLFTIAVLAISFQDTMRRFDAGIPASAKSDAMTLMVEIVQWPIVTLITRSHAIRFFGGMWGYLLLFLNSLTWGTMFILLYSLCHRLFVRNGEQA